MNEKLYNHIENEDVIYSDWYAKHVSAMTGESLHSKSDIACELAYRDIRITELEQESQRLSHKLAEAEKVVEVAKDINAYLPKLGLVGTIFDTLTKALSDYKTAKAIDLPSKPITSEQAEKLKAALSDYEASKG